MYYNINGVSIAVKDPDYLQEAIIASALKMKFNDYSVIDMS